MTLRLRIGLLAFGLLATPTVAQPVELPTGEHRAAGTEFAQSVAGFTRTRVTRFDATGRDIAANYEWEGNGGRILATIYIYPARTRDPGARARACRAEQDGVEASIQQRFTGARRGPSTAPVGMAGVEATLAHRSVFTFNTEFAVGGQVTARAVRSEAHLYCNIGGEWLVKYRFTMNAELNGQTAIEAFIWGSAWPRGPVARSRVTASAVTPS